MNQFNFINNENINYFHSKLCFFAEILGNLRAIEKGCSVCLPTQYAEHDLNKIESTLAETLVALILIP